MNTNIHPTAIIGKNVTIPFYISCPKQDKQLFKDILGKENYTLLLDEDIITLEHPIDGWRSQQIVKSNIHKLKITENYVFDINIEVDD